MKIIQKQKERGNDSVVLGSPSRRFGLKKDPFWLYLGTNFNSPVITMSLSFLFSVNLIGKRIGDMGGVDYMQFIVPGDYDGGGSQTHMLMSPLHFWR